MLMSSSDMCFFVTFFSSQTSGVFLCPLVLSVAMCCILAICHVPNACPLPSALHSLPSVWPCLCSHYLFYSLLPSASSAAICCPLLLKGLLTAAILKGSCVPSYTKQNEKMSAKVRACFFVYVFVAQRSNSVHC